MGPPAAAAGTSSVSGLAMGAGLVTVAASRGGPRLVAVDTAARTAGIRPGLTLASARALLPALAVRPADPPTDAHALEALADWCSRWTPWAAVDPDTTHRGPFGAGRGLLLDISGCTHLFGDGTGGEARLLEDLLARVRRLGFEARAAIAGTAGAAWAVARFGGASQTEGETEGQAIIAAEATGAALAPLPVAALRVPAETATALHRLGLRRVRELMALPRAPLAARFGDLLLRRLDQALGRIDEPLSPRFPPPAFRARLAFAEPIGRSEDVAAALEHLLVDMCARLQAAGMGARRLEFALYRVDGTLARTAIGTSRPGRAPDHLCRLFREKLEVIDAGFGIEVATLDATLVDPLPPAQTPLRLPMDADDSNDGRSAEPLTHLVDRLANRLGSGAVVHLAPVESHIPERAWRTVPVMDGARSPEPHPQHRARPRPLLLLATPEPVEVIAPVPDGPPALLRRGRTLHRILRAEGPERIGSEWWLAVAGQCTEDDARVRDYWRIEDADGQRFWIFREGLPRPDRPPRWWLHGLFG